jgi:hypothetical protein
MGPLSAPTLAAAAAALCAVLLHRLLAAALRWRAASRPSLARRALLARVAPSKHGFLPAVTPSFEFGNVLDAFVKVGERCRGTERAGKRGAARRPPPPTTPHPAQIADAVADEYAKNDAAAFRAWLEAELEGATSAASTAAALASLDGDAARLALVPLVFLAHAHRWGATAPPPWVLAEESWAPPRALARALDPLCALVGMQRTGSATLLFLRNWTLKGREGGREYDPAELTTQTVAPRFRFAAGALAAAETAVLQSVVLTEAAATTTHLALLDLFEAVADDDADRATAAAASVAAGTRANLSVFHAVFKQSNLSTTAWAVHLQPFYCALTPGEHGVGGAQFPFVHASDAALGVDAAADALGGVVAANRGCLLPEERLFVAYLEAHSRPARRWLARGGERAAQARRHWNGAVSALVAWRATHRARAAAYLAPTVDAPSRGTTGGTAAYGGGVKEADGDGGGETPSTPTSVLDADATVAGFRALMDGRIASTRRATVGEGGGMAALFAGAGERV